MPSDVGFALISDHRSYLGFKSSGFIVFTLKASRFSDGINGPTRALYAQEFDSDVIYTVLAVRDYSPGIS